MTRITLSYAETVDPHIVSQVYATLAAEGPGHQINVMNSYDQYLSNSRLLETPQFPSPTWEHPVVLDRLAQRQHALRVLGGEALLIVSNKQPEGDDTLRQLSDPDLLDITTAHKLRKEGLYKDIVTLHPLEEYDLPASTRDNLQGIGVTSAETLTGISPEQLLSIELPRAFTRGPQT